jgi:hypothetical protein
MPRSVQTWASVLTAWFAQKWRGVKVECPLGKASDPLENLIGGLGPDERLRIRMMRINALANGGLQLGDTAVYARRSCLFVNSTNQRSTKLSHDP